MKCSAVDRLMRLQKKTYVGFPLTENGVKECASHDIKDEVVTRLLIESYNESIDANNEVNGIK